MLSPRRLRAVVSRLAAIDHVKVIRVHTRMPVADPARITPEVEQRYVDLQRRAGNRRALGQRLAQHNMGRDVGQLARLVMPTLITWGGEDRCVRPEGSAAFAAAAPAAQVTAVPWPRLSHEVFNEREQDQVLAAVTGWLDGVFKG